MNWLVKLLTKNSIARKALATLLVEEYMKGSPQATLFNMLTVDYAMIEAILMQSTEGSFVEFKQPNGTSIIIGKVDGKIINQTQHAGRYY